MTLLIAIITEGGVLSLSKKILILESLRLCVPENGLMVWDVRFFSSQRFSNSLIKSVNSVKFVGAT